MSAQANPYRNASDEVAIHARRLLGIHQQRESAKLGAIYRWRWARIGFGGVGIVAATFSLLAIAFADDGLLLALALGWAAALVGGLGGYLGASRRCARAGTRRLPGVNDDPYELVIRLSKPTHTDEDGLARIEQIARLGLSSHRLPLLVAAMLFPMTLLAVFLVLNDLRPVDLHDCMRYSLAYTLHVHLYAVVAAWRFPIRRNAVPVIMIAAGVGVVPFLVSGLVVGVVATLCMAVYFIPLGSWVESENRWLIAEQRHRIASRICA